MQITEGAYTVPYHKDFPTESSLDEMVIIDANNDGSSWSWNQYQKYAELSTPIENPVDDDWLISPAIHMEAGKAYNFSTLISCGNPESFPPTVEIFVGSAPTAEGMTQPLIERVTLSKYDNYFDQQFSVPATGEYHIGVHGCSTVMLALLKFMYMDISGGNELTAPGAVTDAVVEPDWSGRTNNANISFKAPTTTSAGDVLESIVKIEIRRDGTVVKTFDNPTPGESLSHVDNVPAAGDYTYAIVPFGSAGEGGKVEQSITVGHQGMTVPYLEDFSSSSRFENDLIFIDANNDGQSFWHASASEPPYAWIHHGESSPTNDDYLIIPALHLEANTMYKVSADAWAYGECFEILGGDAPKVGNLTTKIMALTKTEEEMKNYSGTFTSTYAGNYYFAIHVKTDERFDDFHITNIRVDRIGETSSPSAITGLGFTPGDGNTLNIAFNAPTKNLKGENLSEISEITVSRDGTQIKSFSNPTPGAKLTLSDTPDNEGEHIYVFTPWSATASGESVEHVAFVGTDVPATPENIKAEYIGDGKVKVTWDPVTLTAHGVSVPAKEYAVLEVNNGNQRTLTTTSATEYTYKAVEPEGQALVYYGIFPFNEEGEQGEYGVSNNCYAGKPYEMAFKESFTDGTAGNTISIENVRFSPQWSLATDASFSDVLPSDGDNGMVAMYGGNGSSGRLSTGMIDLATNAVNPNLSFNVYNIVPEEYTNEIHVDVREAGSDEWTEIYGTVIKDLSSSAGWQHVNVDLSAYKGKTIHISLRPVGKDYLWTIFDAIRVANFSNKDLGINIGASSTEVESGNNVTLTLTVSNNGQDDADKYSIELYKNGKLDETFEETSIPAGITRVKNVSRTLDVQDTDNVEFYAKVILPGDEMESDNVTKNVTVNVMKPVYPTVNNLTASANNGVVKLTWDEPSMENVAPVAEIESFEEGVAWAKDGAAGWTFVDEDKAPVIGFNLTYTDGTEAPLVFPGIESGVSAVSFFVLDSSENALDGLEVLWPAATGTKLIGSLRAASGPGTDDWAISPELYGGRQTVHYFARAFSASFMEEFQAYYSTGSTDPKDFLPAGQIIRYNSESWAEFTVGLPAGAKRFAIRNMGTQSGMLLIDDVSLRLAGGAPEELEFIGYNVYREGVRLNQAPLSEKSFTDASPLHEPSDYSVSALYDQGESNSSHVSIDTSGVEDMVTSAVTILTGMGKIVVAGAEGSDILIASADGKTVFNGVGSAVTTINVASGFYIVKAGKHTAKVMVK